MSDILSLNAAGYRIDFDFQPHPTITDGLRGKIFIRTTCDFQPQELQTKEFLLVFKDLLMLARYLENHLKGLLTNQNIGEYSDAPLFTDDSMAYSLRAGLGIVQQDLRGSFPLYMMVNVGFDTKLKKRVYVGFNAIVEAIEVTRFIRQIREKYAI